MAVSIVAEVGAAGWAFAAIGAEAADAGDFASEASASKAETPPSEMAGEAAAEFSTAEAGADFSFKSRTSTATGEGFAAGATCVEANSR